MNNESTASPKRAHSSNAPALARGLKNRHIQLIALGGAIGTGLFYGSAKSIELAGPSVLVAYIIGGGVMYLIMRMLGEMVTEEPVAGTFSHFAQRYWGGFAGFLSGWNYWMLYVLASMVELTAIGHYVHFWWPTLPGWVAILGVWGAVTALNLFQVKLFGEFEFWLALIKIVAIIAMIVLGGWLIVQHWGQPDMGVANFWQQGGFMPHGISGLLLSLVVVMFSFGGTELIGVTAAEADNPRKSIPRAINQVLWRILVFYVGAMAVLIMLYPWNQIGAEGSPFVTIFADLGIPAAPTLLNIVVLTAAVSVYNSGMYSNGRMLYQLAQQGDAPGLFARINEKGVPMAGVLASAVAIFMAVVVNVFMPESAFLFVLALATAAASLTLLMIVLIHWRFRAYHQGRALHFPALWFPWANIGCVVFLVMLVGLMTQLDSTRAAVFVLPCWLLLLAGCYWAKKRLFQG